MEEKNTINSALKSRIKKLEHIIDVESAKIEEINACDEPLTPAKYHEFHDILDDILAKVSFHEDQIVQIKEEISEYDAAIKAARKKSDELGKALNKNKFKFGLKGTLKQSYSRSGSCMRRLTEEEQHARSQPYAATPYEPASYAHTSGGGAQTRKKKRTRKQKTRKTRS